jgi:hypothetical protein
MAGMAAAALFTALEPDLAKLLQLGLDALVKELTVVPYATAGMTADIIVGIDDDHPDWDGAKKAAWVRDAVKQYMQNRGVVLPSDAAINMMIEAGVQALQAGLLTPEQLAALKATPPAA